MDIVLNHQEGGMYRSSRKSWAYWLWTVVIGLGLLAPVARSAEDPLQGQQPVPMFGNEFQFIPGVWGRYRLTGKEVPAGSQMYFAVLEKVPQCKGQAFWIEVEVYTNGHSAVVTRLLVPDTGAGPGDAHKAYVQITGYRPFEVPRKYLRAYPKQPQKQVGRFQKYNLAGEPKESALTWRGRPLKVTTVEAIDPQGRPATATISREAPPLCVVKLDSPDTRMELLDWGTGAKSKLTGKPVGLWRWVWGVAWQAARSSQSVQP
ncbi:MAG: hypothetical protein GX634_09645 [Lentisphaerae bacterium]|nr:hypothetical protein [Lentisphaerota bacterium]